MEQKRPVLRSALVALPETARRRFTQFRSVPGACGRFRALSRAISGFARTCPNAPDSARRRPKLPEA
eukprot:10796046-Alexandrium_andersonii.AAC.1